MRAKNKRGQVLFLITLALIAMCGVLGLVVDLGWSYFTRKSAQAAADSAALAAAGEAYEALGQTGPYMCGASLTCQAVPVPCPAPGNLNNGCLYAEKLGFTTGGSRGRQTVTMAADTALPVPTAPGVSVFYWTTARVTEAIPQLFSAVHGHRMGLTSARATAGIVDMVLAGNLWTLNRESDPGTGRGGPGNDIYVQGNSSITAGGIFMASAGDGVSGPYAGHAGGAATVTGSSIAIRGSGAVDNPGNFLPSAQNGFADIGNMFQDPMRGKGQPPAPPLGLPEFPVSGGSLDCRSPLQPGVYYAVGPQPGCKKNCPIVATGSPLVADGCTFSAGPSGFGEYVFFGGLRISGTSTFSPGRYVLAGTTTGVILAQGNKDVMQDHTPLLGGQSQPNTDAGEIFIFTDANYPGLQVPAMVAPIRSSLRFGDIAIQAGNHMEVNLHGLNRNAAGIPEELKTFAPTVFWQDQRNSYVKYTPDGYIDTTSCGAGHSLDNPCPNNSPNVAPEIHLQAHPNVFLYGLFYQPRGAFLTLQGNGNISTPLQLITGALSLQGGPDLTLLPVGNPLTRRVVALIE